MYKTYPVAPNTSQMYQFISLVQTIYLLELHAHPISNRHSHFILSLPKTLPVVSHSNPGRYSSLHHVLNTQFHPYASLNTKSKQFSHFEIFSQSLFQVNIFIKQDEEKGVQNNLLSGCICLSYGFKSWQMTSVAPAKSTAPDKCV